MRGPGGMKVSAGGYEREREREEGGGLLERKSLMGHQERLRGSKHRHKGRLDEERGQQLGCQHGTAKSGKAAHG